LVDERFLIYAHIEHRSSHNEILALPVGNKSYVKEAGAGIHQHQKDNKEEKWHV